LTCFNSSLSHRRIPLYVSKHTLAQLRLNWAQVCTASIQDVDLDQQPQYTCLSYVWGVDPPGTQKPIIVCLGTQLEVSINCHSALQRLRTMLGGFTIWIDAICINQENPREKSHQVAMMGRIYSAAKTVYIWLGDGTPASDKAMNYMAEAGFVEYFAQPTDLWNVRLPPRLANPQIQTAFWSAITSQWSSTRHPFPCAGDILF
jgi:hypothetical protein